MTLFLFFAMSFPSNGQSLAQCQSVVRANAQKCDDLFKARHADSVKKLAAAGVSAKLAGDNSGSQIAMQSLADDSEAWGQMQDSVGQLLHECQQACQGVVNPSEVQSARTFLKSCESHAKYANDGANTNLAQNGQTYGALKKVSAASGDVSTQNAECGEDCQHPRVIQDAQPEQGEVERVRAANQDNIPTMGGGQIRVTKDNFCLEAGYNMSKIDPKVYDANCR